jgi:hypothetical protein
MEAHLSTSECKRYKQMNRYRAANGGPTVPGSCPMGTNVNSVAPGRAGLGSQGSEQSARAPHFSQMILHCLSTIRSPH